MALARFILKNLQKSRAISPASTQKSSCEILKQFSTAADQEEKSEAAGREVAVSEGGKKSKLFPRRNRRRSLWRKGDDDDISPAALWELFPSGLGNALLQATDNMNRVLERLTPPELMGRFREKEDRYTVRFDLPGLGKENVKITVEDGMLRIKGEQKLEEEGEGSAGSDEYWSSRSYGYYDTSIELPDDAKEDEIKAEMKDGVLCLTIPRIQRPSKDVKEIQVQ